MKTITTQNLKFIDNYLKNSEIFYDDIRMELNDHIASAVEEKMLRENSDFYDAFKDFMIHNKKEILRELDKKGIQWYLSLIQTYTKNRLVIVCSNEPREYEFCLQKLRMEDFK